ncbi:hypothetical protein CIW48_27720, partial [Methylobacterium sp. P1-11]
MAFAAYLMVVLGTLTLFSLNIYARVNQDVQQYPSYHFYALALINALVLGKFMLVAEMTGLGSLAMGRHLRQGPLVCNYPPLWRCDLGADGFEDGGERAGPGEAGGIDD